MTRLLFCTACTIFLILPPHGATQPAEISLASKKIRPSRKKIQLNGISNAGKINSHFFRGSPLLRKLGVTTIIDLRGEHRSHSENKKS
jgi:hypothetical protein